MMIMNMNDVRYIRETQRKVKNTVTVSLCLKTYKLFEKGLTNCIHVKIRYLVIETPHK